MRGINIQFDNLLTHLQQNIHNPQVLNNRQTFDLVYEKITLQTLKIVSIIFEDLVEDYNLIKSYENLMKEIKQFIKLKPLINEDDQDDYFDHQFDQLQQFMNNRKPIKQIDTTQRGDIFKFLSQAQSKQKDMEEFMGNMSKLQQIKDKKSFNLSRKLIKTAKKMPTQVQQISVQTTLTNEIFIKLQQKFPLIFKINHQNTINTCNNNLNGDNLLKDIEQKITKTIQQQMKQKQLKEQQQIRKKQEMMKQNMQKSEKISIQKKKKGQNNKRNSQAKLKRNSINDFQKNQQSGFVKEKYKINKQNSSINEALKSPVIQEIDKNVERQNKLNTIHEEQYEGQQNRTVKQKKLTFKKKQNFLDNCEENSQNNLNIQEIMKKCPNLSRQEAQKLCQLLNTNSSKLSTQTIQIGINTQSSLNQTILKDKKLKLNKQQKLNNYNSQRQKIKQLNKKKSKSTTKTNNLRKSQGVQNSSRTKQQGFPLLNQNKNIKFKTQHDSDVYNSKNMSKMGQTTQLQSNKKMSQKSQILNLPPIQNNNNTNNSTNNVKQNKNVEQFKKQQKLNLHTQDYMQKLRQSAYFKALNQNKKHNKENYSLDMYKSKKSLLKHNQLPSLHKECSQNMGNSIHLQSSCQNCHSQDSLNSLNTFNTIQQYLKKGGKFMNNRDMSKQQQKVMKELQKISSQNMVKVNHKNIQMYIQFIQTIHHRRCGTKCIHLERFYEFLKRKNLHNRRQFIPHKTNMNSALLL